MPDLIPYQTAEATLTPIEKVGQFFMPAAFINDSETEIQQLEELLRKHHVGGLCFFHSRASAATNFEGNKKIIFNTNGFSTLKNLIERYQKVAKYPLLISIDAEWGLAMRIEDAPQYPYAITLGALQGKTDLIFEVGKNIARDCKVAGIHWNLSPVVDINNNPNNPVIGYRSFGEHKEKVVEKALAFMKGTQSEGILTSIKHFPGHGDTATDSHLGLPLIEKSKKDLIANELCPFQKLIAAGADAVMVGHLSVPALANGSTLSSSISKDIIKGLLREEMGFQGVVISDALNMHAVAKANSEKGELEWLAFDAGNDILCFVEHVAEGIQTILKNADATAIASSFERIWRLKEKAFLDVDTSSGELSDPTVLNAKIAVESLTMFKEGNTLDTALYPDNFLGIAMGKAHPNHFFDEISKTCVFPSFSTQTHTMQEIQDHLIDKNTVLLALFPPKAKPQNNFDFSKGELAFINETMATKNVILYLFGNPYVLNLFPIEKMGGIVVVYQDFKVFQENAANHFLGNSIAKGQLPITLKQSFHA